MEHSLIVYDLVLTIHTCSIFLTKCEGCTGKSLARRSIQQKPRVIILPVWSQTVQKDNVDVMVQFYFWFNFC